MSQRPLSDTAAVTSPTLLIITQSTQSTAATVLKPCITHTSSYRSSRFTENLTPTSITSSTMLPNETGEFQTREASITTTPPVMPPVRSSEQSRTKEMPTTKMRRRVPELMKLPSFSFQEKISKPWLPLGIAELREQHKQVATSYQEFPTFHSESLGCRTWGKFHRMAERKKKESEKRVALRGKCRGHYGQKCGDRCWIVFGLVIGRKGVNANGCPRGPKEKQPVWNGFGGACEGVEPCAGE